MIPGGGDASTAQPSRGREQQYSARFRDRGDQRNGILAEIHSRHENLKGIDAEPPVFQQVAEAHLQRLKLTASHGFPRMQFYGNPKGPKAIAK